jgi:putative transposase
MPCAGDEVYGSCTELRGFLEDRGQAYVLRVASSFPVTLAAGVKMTCKEAVSAVLTGPQAWETRSAGTGSKGERWYSWALLVLSDNGTAFTGGHFARSDLSGGFGRAVAALGSRLIHSSPYHPQTQGKAERHHQTFRKWLAPRPAPRDLEELQALLDEYRAWYNHGRWHSAVQATPAQSWDAAPALGGPGQLPRQDDASVHQLTVRGNGTVKLGHCYISVGKPRARQQVTAIRDHGRVTVYTLGGDLIGYLNLDHGKSYQGQLQEAA